MPEAFLICAKQKGAKIRTKTLPGGKYQHVCILNGKEYLGEVKTKKK